MTPGDTSEDDNAVRVQLKLRRLANHSQPNHQGFTSRYAELGRFLSLRQRRYISAPIASTVYRLTDSV